MHVVIDSVWIQSGWMSVVSLACCMSCQTPAWRQSSTALLRSHEPHNLFSAALAHPNLHQAAVLVLKDAAAPSSITCILTKQQVVNGMLLYMKQHGQKASSISLEGSSTANSVTLRELPVPHRNLQRLSSLNLSRLSLHLSSSRSDDPGAEAAVGVLGGGVPLKQLKLDTCWLRDGLNGLTAALPRLHKLERLSLVNTIPYYSFRLSSAKWRFFDVPQRSPMLQHLTFLEIEGVGFPGGQDLQGLTGLQDLRLVSTPSQNPFDYDRMVDTIHASTLAGMHHLTRLQVNIQGPLKLGSSGFDAGALQRKTLLQHLHVTGCTSPPLLEGEAGTAQLLSALQPLQQLTYLCLRHSPHNHASIAPASFSTLTASSKLQHLDISHCTLPADVWQHIYPNGRQLPRLQALHVSDVRQLKGVPAAPEGSRLVSCCPGLQSLHMQGLGRKAQVLSPLSGLSGLSELSLCPAAGMRSAQGLGEVCQLTGLQRLTLWTDSEASDVFRQLTQLKQLTWLEVGTRIHGNTAYPATGAEWFNCAMPGTEPVWKQVLRHGLNVWLISLSRDQQQWSDVIAAAKYITLISSLAPGRQVKLRTDDMFALSGW